MFPIAGVSQTRQLKIASQARTVSERALIVSAAVNPLPRTAPAAIAIHSCASRPMYCSKSTKVAMLQLPNHHEYFTITSSLLMNVGFFFFPFFYGHVGRSDSQEIDAGDVTFEIVLDGADPSICLT